MQATSKANGKKMSPSKVTKDGLMPMSLNKTNKLACLQMATNAANNFVKRLVLPSHRAAAKFLESKYEVKESRKEKARKIKRKQGNKKTS